MRASGAGAPVVRVVWLPGSDRLEGICHCGATTVADGPVEVWEWLFAHPVDHHTAGHHPAGPADPAPAEPALATIGGRR
ncbi:hypothetical protein [Pseudonocardia sp. KRD291]|uniref:hypothetical protein n=1 Tax=Pseudonocardia sp. KRD291 TaxID=2792007 RepID=UPI001C49CEE9|nr:hypothetical protein [Pseudonocardia sp. KRD291]MBW0103029.1 hypothetical protein [Pseudonocardia sp. KRD291]